ASVTATDHIVAHVSNRRSVLRFPRLRLRDDSDREVLVDYVIADLWYLQQYEPAFEDYRKSLQQAMEQISKLIDRRYGVVDFQDGVILLKRRATSNPEALAAWLAYQQDVETTLRSRPPAS
ncbi:MAG TPA: DUF2079 domain-containing protein, partial [Allocoleopsis sp.]